MDFICCPEAPILVAGLLLVASQKTAADVIGMDWEQVVTAGQCVWVGPIRSRPKRKGQKFGKIA